MSAPAPSVSPELKSLMRRLKLGRLLDTLPERLALARTHQLSASEFLEQLFSDEVQRRDAASAGLRARKAHLDPAMVLEAWDAATSVAYDHSAVSYTHLDVYKRQGLEPRADRAALGGGFPP